MSYDVLNLKAFSSRRHTSIKTKFKKQVPWVEHQVISDDEGHLLIVKGLWCGQKVTLVNLYLPNEDQVSYLEACLSKLDQHTEASS